ncbi:restriction endonuclease subunit S [Mycoplasma yeatsii]|uniref:restriction endonuclease subunit S n=1 Tax=Mycoplasma yeatsii TaxID=51365 RepID=UPI0003A3F8A6|nr:restriction endonuclease subunit S [Mycoplasma yeatsii]
MKRYKLSELIKIKNGKDYKGKKQGEIPVYGTGGIVTEIDDFLYSGESVLLPRKGSLSNIIYVNKPFWTIDTMYWTIINDKKVYPKYLYYYLKSIDISSLYSGTSIPSMTFDSYYNISIDIPEMFTQKKILKILNSIDLKIELNNKINDNLVY